VEGRAPEGMRRERQTRTFRVERSRGIWSDPVATWFHVVESFWKVVDYFDPVTRTYYGKTRTLERTVEHPRVRGRPQAEQEMVRMSVEASTAEDADDGPDSHW
jgi:hypothetical protein